MRYRIEDSPDALLPSDNSLDIPVLRRDMAADYLDLPVLGWGSGSSRRYTDSCSVHFYTDDYRFSALWAYPGKLLATGVVTVVEPNYSLGSQTPEAIAIWRTFQKRWLCRYWQDHGVRVIVDLSVPSRFAALNMLGVPGSWPSYAYRGYNQHDLADLERAYRLACSHAGGRPDLFVVYGGGYDYRLFCADHGLVWLPEDAKARSAKRSQRDYQLAKAVGIEKVGVMNRGR